MLGFVGHKVSVLFYLTEPDLVTPLVGAANQVISTLYFDGALSGIDVDIVDNGNGSYFAAFTPDAAGNYSILVEHVSGQRYGADIAVVEDVAAIGADVQIDADALEMRTLVMEHVYTCPTFLTEMGYNLDDLDATQRWALIRTVAARIDVLTNQWFNADYGVWRMDGKGSPLVQHPSSIPILSVEKVEVDAQRTNYRNAPPPTFLVDFVYAPEGGLTGGWSVPALGVLASTTYAAHKRALERIRGHFPGGALNVALTGALGWADDYARFEQVISTEIDADSTEMTLPNVDGIKARDVIDIIGPLCAVRVIAHTVDKALKKVYFDPVGPRSLPSALEAETAICRRLSTVPRPIESVANFLFGQALQEFRANAAGEPAIDPARIKKEATDGYSYELFPAAAGEAVLTGSAIHDRTLRAFSAPGRALVI